MALKEAYQEKVEAQLREWTARINELKAKADGAKGDAKIEMYKRIEVLRAKQEVAQAKFRELKQRGADKWEEIRSSLDQAMDDLKTTWDSIMSKREDYQEKIEAQIKKWAAKLNEMTAKGKAYQEKVEAQLREWTARINELKAKADGTKADAKIEMYKRIEVLRAKQEVAQAKFQELKQRGADKWEEIRTSLDQAMDDLKTTWEGTRSKREDYQEKIEAQIKEWAEKLNEMTAKAQQASADVKAKMLKEIAEIRDRKDELQQKLTELKSAGAEKWESLEASFEKGMEGLKKRWDSFKTKYL